MTQSPPGFGGRFGLAKASLAFHMSLCFFAGVWLVLAAGAPAGAQSVDQNQRERIVDEPFRLRMDEDAPAGKRVLFDWGGYFRSSIWGGDERVDRDADGLDDGYRGWRRQQLRLWGLLELDQVHHFYARAKLDYVDWNSGSSIDHNDSDWEGPDLDRGWYEFRLSRYRAAYDEPIGDFDFAVKLGRQYVEFGTGLALSVPLDAGLVSAYYGDWQVTGLGGQSLHSAYNIDRSFPGDAMEERTFYGVQLRYNGWPNHKPFVYFFGQEDDDFGVVREGQVFGYDSRYLGLGSRGQLGTQNLQYTVEGVFESGRSHAFDTDGCAEDIRAWAWDTELRYLFSDARHSELTAEYLLASGDGDREYSPTNTIGGNRAGTDDTSFVGWGFRDTGLALAALPSNLGMLRIGASTFPARMQRCFEKLKVGVSYYLYHKQQAGGALSDNVSLDESCYAGSEMDLFVHWRFTSDLAWTVRYGLFWPGAAFVTDDERHVIFTGLTLNF